MIKKIPEKAPKRAVSGLQPGVWHGMIPFVTPGGPLRMTHERL